MMNLTLIIGNKNYSSWSLRPWVFMKQHQIEFNEKRIALLTDTTDSQLHQYNSDYKVPILMDDGLVVWDSLAILEYLSEKYMDNKGWPADTKTRATARSISAEMHSSFTHVRNELPMNCRKKFQSINLSPTAGQEIERIKKLWRNCRNEFGKDGEWLFGKYTIADAMFAPIVLRFVGYSIPLNGLEEDYAQSVFNQACIKDWIDAGKQETEVIETDEIED